MGTYDDCLPVDLDVAGRAVPPVRICTVAEALELFSICSDD